MYGGVGGGGREADPYPDWAHHGTEQAGYGSNHFHDPVHAHVGNPAKYSPFNTLTDFTMMAVFVSLRSLIDVIRLDLFAHHNVRGSGVHVRREKLFHLMRGVELPHRTVRLDDDRGLLHS
jgi:hypothetical protein